LAGSGWQWEQPDSYGATVVGPNQVITAAHLGVGVGYRFHFGGLDYPVLGAVDAPGGDLSVFWVGGRLPAAAPIYRGQSEVGAGVVAFGLGGPRGDAFYAPDLFGQQQLKGWDWTVADLRLRWGTNNVAASSVQGPTGTNYLACLFEADQGPDVTCITIGDSGGGVFLRDTDGQWKLAAVVSAVESQYRLTPGGATIAAAVFDRTGLYEEDTSGQWNPAPDTLARPGSYMLFFRISTYASWIDGVLAGQTPGNPVPKLLSSDGLSGAYAEVAAYAVDPSAKRVTTPIGSGDAQFYRLEGVNQIQAIHSASGYIEIDY
jgi:hypothetical protein